MVPGLLDERAEALRTIVRQSEEMLPLATWNGQDFIAYMIRMIRDEATQTLADMPFAPPEASDDHPAERPDHPAGISD